MAEKKAKLKNEIPSSKESEMMILGCMLTSQDALNIAADSLSALDFYFPEHQIIFGLMQESFHKDKPADVHLIAEELKRQEKLNDVGGIPYLTSIAQYAGTSAYIEEYIEIVRDKAILRKMIDASQSIEKAALSEPDDVLSALDEAQTKFFQISQASSRHAGVLLKELLSGSKTESSVSYLKEIQIRQEKFAERGPNDPSVVGIPTHFVDLDKVLNGLSNSNMMILAARPAMGKTALALNIAENVCFKNNIPTGIFSLEMTAEQVVHRMICSQADVESEKIKNGSLNGIEYQRIVSTVNYMMDKTLIIDDCPGLKISDLRARARRMKEAFNIGLLIIDYLQLLSGSGSLRSVENRQNEISEISRMLKTLARELNIPIICLSQLSRKVEERQGHRPMMSDLRESGSIEQDSDIVMFLLRREYYDPYDKPGQAELIIAKNRHGSIGSVNLTFRKEIAQFANFIPVNAAMKNNEAAFSEFSPE
jgi:replicative DNA helicase